MNTEYTALEKELAELLGWTDVRQVASNLVGQDGIDWRQVPVWCSDDAAAFQLMVDNLLCVDCLELPVVVQYSGQSYRKGGKYVTEYALEHHDKATAVRVAIVKAVIAKLKEAK